MNEQRNIKLPIWLATILVSVGLTAVVSLQVWTVQKISALEVTLAGLTARVDDLTGVKHIAKNNNNE